MRLLVSALAAAFCITLAAVTVEASQPRVFHGARAGSLETSRQRLAAGDRGLRTAVDRLVAEADVLLHVSPPSVTHKTHVAPSGDSHDYASLAPYYWPDPQSADGLPYVRRDGRRNPEWSDLSLSDGTRVALLGRGIETLQRITRVGKDLELATGMCGSVSGSIPVTVGQPPILVSRLLVGGRDGQASKGAGMGAA